LSGGLRGWYVKVEVTAVLERVSGWMIAAILPLMYLTALVGVIETFLAFARHRLAFKGVKLLKASRTPGGLALPPDSELEVGRFGPVQYFVASPHELLFTGKPSLVRAGYVLKARAADQGGVTLLEVRAPLWVCLAYVALVVMFLGLAINGFIGDGPVSGIIFLVVGGVVTGLLYRHIRIQVAMTPALLQGLVRHLNRQAEDEE
jgi:hypothetical protein